MMKKYFAMAAVATMFAACTNEDVTPQVDAMTGMPIVVKTNIASPVSSRVAGMDSESDFALFLLNIQGAKEGDTDYFVSMRKQTVNSWKSSAIDEGQNETECEMVWANSNDVTVSALCTGGICSPTSYRNGTVFVSVYADQSEERKFKLSDNLYMSPTSVTPSESGIEVNFKHLVSKVTVTITGASEATEVKVDGIYNIANFAPSTGRFSPKEGASILTFTACKDSYTESTGVSVYEAILVPQEVEAGKFSVSFKIGDVTYKWTSADNVTLESNKLYSIALTVAEDGGGETTDPMEGKAILLKSISVAPWPTTPTVIGGETNEATKQ